MNKYGKQWIAMILTLIMLVPHMAHAQEKAVAERFTDLREHWAETTITEWVDRGWVKGQSTDHFNPSAPITRAELAALVNKAFGFEEKSPSTFFDVSAAKWYAPEVAKAVQAGYMLGDEKANFRPEASITRQEFAVLISRVLFLMWEEPMASYTDLAASPSWSKGAIGAVIRENLMSGSEPGRFAPLSHATRAEAVVILDRALAYERPQHPSTEEPRPVAEPAANVKGNVTIKGDLKRRSLSVFISPDYEKSPNPDMHGISVSVKSGSFAAHLPVGHYVISTYDVQEVSVQLHQKVFFEVSGGTRELALELPMPNFTGMLYDVDGKTPLHNKVVHFNAVDATGSAGIFLTTHAQSTNGRVAAYLPDGKYKGKMYSFADGRKVLVAEDIVVEGGKISSNPFESWQLPAAMPLTIKGGGTLRTDTFDVVIIPAGVRQFGVHYPVIDGQLKIHMKPGDYQIVGYRVPGQESRPLVSPIRFTVPGEVKLQIG